MAENLEPINIDINMRQNVSEESDKAAAGMENLSTVSSASLDKMAKDFAAQAEVIKNMQFIIDELQKKIAEGSGDIISQESVDRLNEAQEVLTGVSDTVTAYQENMEALSEANTQGADITQVFTDANQTLTESQSTLADTMGEILETHNELNEATEANTDNTDDNTESTEENTVANKIMSAAIKGVCDALGIENTAVVNAISSTRTITAVKSAWTRATQLLNTQLGISIGMSKALVASGIGLILVAVAAAVVAYRAWTEEDRILEKAQESVNQTLEESAQKKQELESQTQSYIGIVNTETKAINDQITAYRKLQETFPQTLRNIDLQTFKLMGATQQQKLLNEAISQQASKDQDDYLDRIRQTQQTAFAYSGGDNPLNISKHWKKRSEVYDAIGADWKDNLTTPYAEAVKILEKKVELLEKEKRVRAEIAEQAEFEKKPESERKAILEAQLESLQAQKNALENNNKEAGNSSVILQGVKDKAEGVTNSMVKWGEQPNALSNIFSNASLQASILDAQITGIQGKIDALNGTGSAAIIKNEEYWTKRKKSNEAFIKGLDSSVLSVLESGTGNAALDPSVVSSYQKALKGIAEAEKELLTFRIPAQEGTKGFYEQKQKQAQALLDSMTDLDKGSAKWKATVKEYNDATDKLKSWDIKGQNKDADKAAKAAEKLREKQKKATEDLAKKSLDIQVKIDTARVEAMEEGAAKQRAALKAEYDKEKALIEQELKEIEKLEAITKEPATGQRNQLTQLDAAVTAEYEAKIKALDEASEKAIREIFDDVNQKFTSELDNNLAQINKYYDDQIKKAKESGATIAQINLLTSAKQKETTLANLDAKQQEIDFETEIALRREAMSGKFYLLEADRQMALLKIQEDAARKTLEILKKKYAQSPTKELENDIKAATVALEGFGVQGKALKMEKLKQAADYIAEAAGMLNSLFQEDGAFSNETLAQITSTVGSIAQGFASGGIIGGAMAAAGEAINLINAAAQAEKRHQEALKVLQQAKIAMQREYLQLLLEEQLQYKNGTSIFGTDTIGKVVNAIDVYRKSIKAYKEELQGDFSPNEAYEKSLQRKADNGGFFGAKAKKQLDEYRKQLELYKKGTAALYDAEIVTGHKKTGLFGWGKGKDTYSKILDVYPDVIDAEGKLNKERVQSILDTRKMDDETRNLLQSLLDLEEQAASAQEEMRSLLESTFGSLGDSLATAIVDAFASGDDALMKFRDNVTDVLNGFAKQMVYSMFLSKIFTNLQGDIEDAYNKLADGAITEQDLSNKVTDLLGDFFGGLGGTVDQANDFLEEFWKNAESAGFTRPEGERKGTSAGLERISQDSANELNGNFYALRQQVGDIRNLQKEANTMRKTMQAQLARITENTEYCRYLADIKNILEDNQTRGVKMRV